MIELWAAFIGGLLGSAHCIGMCGGFAAAIGATDLPIRPVLARQLYYSMGRVCTYAFLGAVGGSAGLFLAKLDLPLVCVQQVFSFVAGVVMLLVGVSVFGFFRPKWRWLVGVTNWFAPVFAQLLGARKRLGFFVVGLANGFLPCGLVYAFLAQAVASGDVLVGMLQMACFGAGTIPAMVAVGCGSKLLSHTVRVRVYRVAACLVILLGVVTIRRAFIPSRDCCAKHAEAPAEG